MVIMASGIARGRVRTTATTGSAQHGGHSPNNMYFFDFGHPCYDQLAPVKTRYLLTSIM